MIRSMLRRILGEDKYKNFERSVISVNNYKEIQKMYGWREDPDLARDDINDFDYAEDLNERRIRDAEMVGVVVRNATPKVVLEIGTADGAGTALMSANAPQATIYTVNIPPEEILSGEGGKLTTVALAREEIGRIYKARNVTNVKQIYANTATWKPDIGLIDIAFIDGCHDKDFVINDTLKILPFMQPGGYVMWHDANPELCRKFHWIGEVCSGIDWLIAQGHLDGRLYWLRDSWTCLWRVPTKESGR